MCLHEGCRKLVPIFVYFAAKLQASVFDALDVLLVLLVYVGGLESCSAQRGGGDSEVVGEGEVVK